MDRNFHIDDFERLLREKSEEFRMYPSKRIWYSIYNNIHPGRKWPSVAMSITLITTLLLVGYLNTKNTNPYIISGEKQVSNTTLAQTKSFQTIPLNITTTYNGNLGEVINAISNVKTSPASGKNVNKNISLAKGAKTAVSVALLNDIPSITTSKAGKSLIANNNFISAEKKETIGPSFLGTQPRSISNLRNSQIQTIADSKNSLITIGDELSVVLNYPQKTPQNNFTEIIPLNDFALKDDSKKVIIKIQDVNFIEKDKLATNKKDILSSEDREWIENYALYNRPFPKKWHNKLSWQLYATPSIVYRKLVTDPEFGNSFGPAIPTNSANMQDLNRNIDQKPSIGFEMGAGFLYSVFKGVKLKAGLQLNYTRYNSHAFQNTHPVVTKLMMHDYKTNLSYEEYRTTPYSNKNGLEAVKLHNQTFQVSLPIGADFKLIGNENLQLNLGVTIQPTYIVMGKSYLISSDRRYYVQETSMLNKWNLNAGFETFVSYKGSNGFTYQFGPQFRTQLYTTNNKKFAVEERLLNYGIKFGISKTLK